MTKPRIYVAGPYSRGIPDETFARVADAAERLVAAGWTPFIPHTMTFLWAVRHQHPVDFWYEFDFEWLAACHAIVRLPGDSKGADAEVERARQAGLRVLTLEEACVGVEHADFCPRCQGIVLRPLEGGPDTPLCDPCWGLLDHPKKRHHRVAWAVKAGWNPSA